LVLFASLPPAGLSALLRLTISDDPIEAFASRWAIAIGPWLNLVSSMAGIPRIIHAAFLVLIGWLDRSFASEAIT